MEKAYISKGIHQQENIYPMTGNIYTLNLNSVFDGIPQFKYTLEKNWIVSITDYEKMVYIGIKHGIFGTMFGEDQQKKQIAACKLFKACTRINDFEKEWQLRTKFIKDEK